MGRPRKYHTDEERKAAQLAGLKKYYNSVKGKEAQKQWLVKNGYSKLSEYQKQTPRYQAKLKRTEPAKFKELIDTPPEQTKQHPEFTDYYVAKSSNVYKFSAKRGNWIKIKAQVVKSGYCCIQLYKEGKRHMINLHKIVAECYLGTRPVGDYQIDHIDHNRQNNSISNLQYLTRSANLKRRLPYKKSK
jgi:hypothetical protein